MCLAQLGDGADGLPDPHDPNLPEEYGFEVLAAMVECPECCGNGVIYPGAICGMWTGLVPWPDDVHGQTCDFCDGSGEVPADEAAWYEQTVAESFAE